MKYVIVLKLNKIFPNPMLWTLPLPITHKDIYSSTVACCAERVWKSACENRTGAVPKAEDLG